MNCPRCNNPVSPNARFCEACGAVIAPVQLDMEKTMAADFDEVPAAPEQPVQQASWSQPSQPEPQAFTPPAEPEPQAFTPPAEPEPQAYIPPAESAPNTYTVPEQPADAGKPEWTGGGSVADAWNQPVQTDYSSQYIQPGGYAGGQTYGYSSATQVAVKPKNTKKIVIIAISAAVAVGLIVALILIIVSCAGGSSHQGSSHQVKNDNGTVIAEDSAIDVNDSDAEGKLNSFIDSYISKTQEMDDSSTIYNYARGNALVSEKRLNYKVTDSSQKERMANEVKSMADQDTQSLSMYRMLSGVNDMVGVMAIVDSSGDLIASEVIK